MKHTITFRAVESCGDFTVEADTLEDALAKAREMAKKPMSILRSKGLSWNDFNVEIDGVLG